MVRKKFMMMTVVGALAGGMFGSGAQAQTPPPPPPTPPSAQPPAAGPRGGFDVEQRTAELRTRLSLDAAQTTRVRAILEDAKRRIEALRPSPEERRDPAFRERRRAIRFEVEDAIWGLLTCAQKDAFRLYQREQMSRHHERFAHRRGPHGHGSHGADDEGHGHRPRR